MYAYRKARRGREERQARAAGAHTYLKAMAKGKKKKRRGKEEKGGAGTCAPTARRVVFQARAARRALALGQLRVAAATLAYLFKCFGNVTGFL